MTGAERVRSNRTASSEHPSGNDTGDTEDTPGLDHDGTAVDGAAMEVKNVEGGARVVVDATPTADGDDVVGLAIRSDMINGRAYLDAEAAAEVAERLATVAEEAGADK